jgi:hypothetical protein
VSSTLPAGTPSWRPRLASCAPAGTRTGLVVAVCDGLLDVEVGMRRVRASYDGELLAAVARDSRAAPRPGDQVRLRCWADGRTTVQRVLARALPDAG